MLRYLFLILSLTVPLFGCAGKYQHKLDFNPAESIRVVVVPFVQVDKSGGFGDSDANLLVDNVPFISEKLTETPAKFVRKLVVNELGQSGLDVVSPSVTDGELIHHGFGSADLRIDRQRVYEAKPSEICQHFLACDAVLYGRVLKWDRTYLALQSESRVSIELRLVSAKDGRELFTATAEDSDSRGLSKGPTGFSNLVLEPLRGLDSEIISDLAREMIRTMLQPFKVSARPDYLNTPAPQIYALAYDAVDDRITSGETLKVLASAPSKKSAWFSIGSVVDQIPMIEVGQGNYLGEYFPLPGESFRSEVVTVTVADQFGRTTSMKISGPGVTLSQSEPKLETKVKYRR